MVLRRYKLSATNKWIVDDEGQLTILLKLRICVGVSAILQSCVHSILHEGHLGTVK